MKKISCIFFFLLIGTVGCMPTVHYLVVGIRLTPLEFHTITNEFGEVMTVSRSTTEFTNKAIFGVRTENEQLADNIVPKIDSRCLAFEPIIIFDNEILDGTFSMVFDKPFVYKEDIVEAGTDLFRHPVIAEEIDFTFWNTTWAQGMIEFSDTFTENSSFDDDDYTVTISCSTSDKKFLQTDATVKFAWDK